MLVMSPGLKTFLSMFLASHLYTWIFFSLRLYLCASQAGLGILGSRDLTVAVFSEACGHRARPLCSLLFIQSTVTGHLFGLFILLLSVHKTLLISSYHTHIGGYNVDNVFYVCICRNRDTHLTNKHRLPNLSSRPCSSFLRIQAYFELNPRV